MVVRKSRLKLHWEILSMQKEGSFTCLKKCSNTEHTKLSMQRKDICIWVLMIRETEKKICGINFCSQVKKKKKTRTRIHCIAGDRPRVGRCFILKQKRYSGQLWQTIWYYRWTIDLKQHHHHHHHQPLFILKRSFRGDPHLKWHPVNQNNAMKRRIWLNNLIDKRT